MSVFRLHISTFIKNLQKVAEEFWGTDVDNDISRIIKAHTISRKPTKNDPSKNTVSWWEDDVADLLAQTRAARRRDHERINRDALHEEYVSLRRALTRLIRKKKRDKWKDICQALNEDVLGGAYKIVRAQLKSKGPNVSKCSSLLHKQTRSWKIYSLTVR